MGVNNPLQSAWQPMINAVPGAPLSLDNNLSVVSGINTFEVTSTISITATLSDILMPSMTLSPDPGTYLALFSTDISSALAGAAVSVALYVNSIQDASTLRKVIPYDGGTLASPTGRSGLSINRLITVTAGQPVEIRWSTSSIGPTAAARTFTLIRIA